MMLRRAFILLCVGLLMVMLASCGQTYKLMSITVTTTPAGATTPSASAWGNIEGIGNTATLAVTAHYSNTKTEDVTVKSTFEVGDSTDPRAPTGALTVNVSGIAKAVDPNGTCTWYAEPTNSADTTFAYDTKPYVVTVTYSGFTTTAYVSVDSVVDCYDGITYTAPSGYAGTGTNGF
jgi:hypothetical protein